MEHRPDLKRQLHTSVQGENASGLYSFEPAYSSYASLFQSETRNPSWHKTFRVSLALLLGPLHLLTYKYNARKWTHTRQQTLVCWDSPHPQGARGTRRVYALSPPHALDVIVFRGMFEPDGIQPTIGGFLMIRRCGFLVVCFLFLGLFFAGCQGQKSANQQAGGPDATASSSPSAAESAKNAVKKVLEPKPLVVPADTVISVVLDQTISSKTANAGDKFSATIE